MKAQHQRSVRISMIAGAFGLTAAMGFAMFFLLMVRKQNPSAMPSSIVRRVSDVKEAISHKFLGKKYSAIDKEEKS
jgi:hypothetical protein